MNILDLEKLEWRGFKAFFKRKPIIDNVPLIMETPIDERRDNSDNLNAVLKMVR